MTPTRTAIVTTSWDDGHASDARLGDLLAHHGVRGTFYTPGTFCVPGTVGEAPMLDGAALRQLVASGHEIGGHTRNHAVLTDLDRDTARREIAEGKAVLEDRLGTAVTSFCYPRGFFGRRERALVAECGFRLGRTTSNLRLDAGSDPLAMPVTFQVFPHGRMVHLRHGLKELHGAGLWSWLSLLGGAADLDLMLERSLGHLAEHGGVLHLWGHSWELDRHHLWPVLDRLLARIARQPGLSHRTNREVYGL